MKNDYTISIRDYLDWEISVLNRLDLNAINDVMNAIVEAYQNSRRIYIFGNGGSAATASHFINDFNKGLSENLDKKFNFVCLNDNVPTLLAIANDLGYEYIFEYQLKGKLEPGDIVIAISGSGNSLNILRAVEYAKSQSNRVIGITGFAGGKLANISDISLNVPVDNIQITEDVHMIFNHMIMSILREELIER